MGSYSKEPLLIMIDYLQQGYKTYNQVSGKTGLSEKTVRRNVNIIRQMIDTNELCTYRLLDRDPIYGGVKRRFKLEVKHG